MRPVLLASLLAAAAATACAAGTGDRVRVHISAGTKQCDTSGARGAAGLQALARPLEAAGVRVLAGACGDDGRMRIAVCGAGDGRIAIFDIAAADAAKAAQAGYAPLPADARERPCE
jgi:hypothetical protein